MTITFKQAELPDSQFIKDIAKRVIRHNYTPFLGIEMTSAFIDGGMSDKEIDDGLGRCTIMLSDNTIIGFAIIDEDLLHLIMIDVPYQNKGYGGKLLSHVEAMLFDKYDVIRLQSFEENTDTGRFYLKNGWVITGEETVKELDKTMLLFEKTALR